MPAANEMDRMEHIYNTLLADPNLRHNATHDKQIRKVLKLGMTNFSFILSVFSSAVTRIFGSNWLALETSNKGYGAIASLTGRLPVPHVSDWMLKKMRTFKISFKFYYHELSDWSKVRKQARHDEKIYNQN